MDRRAFIRQAAASAALLIPANHLWAVEHAASQAPVDLAVVKGKDPAALVRRAVTALGGMKRFVSKGDIVAIKPNIAWDRLPEQAATTNPDIVAETVRLCLEAGAKRVRVFDRTVNESRRCYEQSGIGPAVGAVGGQVVHVRDRDFRTTAIKGEVLKKWPIYRGVLEADAVINIPIAKHHSLSRLTMSMKNWMGIMGGRRSTIHQNLGVALVDLSTVVRPALTILDTVRVLTANGPQGGDLEDVRRLDTVVAGVDQVAVDSLGASFFNIAPRELDYLRLAAERRLGETDLSRLRIQTITL